MLTERYELEATPLVDCLAGIRRRGWCEGTSGNFSVTVARDPLRLMITPSGSDKGALSVGDLLLIGEDGATLDDDSEQPSAETALHLTLARRGAGAVLHTHSVWGTLLGERFLERGGLEIEGYEMLKGLDGVRSHEQRVFVPIVGNTQDMNELSGTIDRLFGRHPEMVGFLIAGHGLYTWGRDVAGAYRHVEIFEFLFELLGRRATLAPVHR